MSQYQQKMVTHPFVTYTTAIFHAITVIVASAKKLVCKNLTAAFAYDEEFRHIIDK
jgi:hypothetical protein